MRLGMALRQAEGVDILCIVNNNDDNGDWLTHLNYIKIFEYEKFITYHR